MKNENFKLVSNFHPLHHPPQDERLARQKIERLKDTALTLLREVRTLNYAPTVDLRRGVNFYDEVQRYEISLIKYALARTHGHQVRAARLLGMKVTTLNSMIKRYNISVNEPTDDTSALEEAAP